MVDNPKPVALCGPRKTTNKYPKPRRMYGGAINPIYDISKIAERDFGSNSPAPICLPQTPALVRSFRQPPLNIPISAACSPFSS